VRILSGEISLTANGISIYYAAKNSQNPAERAIADDMNHANYLGRAGEPHHGAALLHAVHGVQVHAPSRTR
jgi:multiple sugar transport system substrate-binding protein